MADLGSIEFRDASGAGGGTQQASADIIGAVGKLGALALKKGEEDVLGDLRGQLKTKNEEVTARQPLPPVLSGDPKFDRLQQLSFAVQQGDRKQQDIARLEGRKVLEEFINKNPRFRGELQAEFNAFTSGDPTFAALGLQDAAAGSTSKLALQEIEDIKSEAFGDGLGQLGMDPLQFPFGSQEFIQQYTFRAGMEQQRSLNAQLLATMNSQRDLGIKDIAAQWQQSLTGGIEIVSGMIETAQKQASQVAVAFLNPTAPGADLVINDWNQGGRDRALADVENSVSAIELSWAEVDINFAGTPEYKAAENLKNATVQQLRTLAQAVATDTPSLMQAYEALETTRRMKFEADFPDLVEIGRVTREIQVVLENIDTFDGTEFTLKNDLGQLVAPTLSGLLGRMRGMSGKGQLTPGLSTPELTEQLDTILLDNPNEAMYNHGITTTRASQTAAFQQAEQQRQLRRLLVASGTDITPAIATQDVISDRQATQQLRQRGPVGPDAYGEHLEKIADKNMVEVLKIARNGSLPTSVVVWGDSMEAFFDKEAGAGGALTRTTEYLRLRDQEIIPGLLPRDVISVDSSSIDDGVLVFRVDEDLIDKLITREVPGIVTQTGALGFGDPGGRQARARAKRIAKQRAQEMSRIVSRDLRAKAHIEFAQQGLEEPDYAAQWLVGEQSFNAIFGDLVQAEIE